MQTDPADVKTFVIRQTPEMRRQWGASIKGGGLRVARISKEKIADGGFTPHRSISKTVMRPCSPRRKNRPRADETESAACCWSERGSIEGLVLPFFVSRKAGRNRVMGMFQTLRRKRSGRCINGGREETGCGRKKKRGLPRIDQQKNLCVQTPTPRCRLNGLPHLLVEVLGPPLS